MKDISNQTLLKEIRKNSKSIKENSKKIEKNSKSIDYIGNQLGKLAAKMVNVERRLDAIEKSVLLIPKLYENVNAFMVEIIENRQERVFMNSKINRNTRRIDKLETRVVQI